MPEINVPIKIRGINRGMLNLIQFNLIIIKRKECETDNPIKYIEIRLNINSELSGFPVKILNTPTTITYNSQPQK